LRRPVFKLRSVCLADGLFVYFVLAVAKLADSSTAIDCMKSLAFDITCYVAAEPGR